jgi:hypothetical protein
MSGKNKKTRQTPAAWFASFPQPAPPGWDDGQGWCLFHIAPILAIPDPAQRVLADRLASMNLTSAYAADIRARVAPLPVPPHHIPELIRAHAPICCWVSEDVVYDLVRAAIGTAGTA